MTVYGGFFDILEKERQKEQSKIRMKVGGMFNLTQMNFTGMLAAKKFRFKIPEQPKPPIRRKLIRRRRK